MSILFYFCFAYCTVINSSPTLSSARYSEDQERAGPTIHLPTEIPEEIHEKHNPFPLGNIKMSSSKLPTGDEEDEKSISSVDEPSEQNK
ncbi:hypothetical protein PGT21_020974 [Puccinia graminis f. sp. tritici]|uniref:Uncharacterized protein n=1 Tax=Puccinia graminis f. sp. tritici TaxID=56615 RepID=A0A5B0NQ35_PUCGR|nr:hypothetical protein PGT21_020974 [Puccinia graminis f. sp. tritici]